jgi:hypothetical protein
MPINRWIHVSLTLGVLSLLAVALSHLALTDIYHAGGDVSLEWNVLRGCFGVFVLSQVAALITLTKVLRSRRQAGAVRAVAGILNDRP